MAERPSELDEQKLARIDENNETALTTEKADDGYLTDLSAETFQSDVETAETSDDAEQIRANIEETRAGMSETIDAIQEKLSFGNISEQVKDEVSDYVSETIQTAKDTVYNVAVEKAGIIMKYVNKGIDEAADTQVVKVVRQNPWALVALIGLGGGILLVRSFQKKQSNKRYQRVYDYDRDDENYDSDYSSKRSYSSKRKKSRFSSAQETVSGAAGKVGETVSNAAGTVSDSVSYAAGAVSDTVGGVASKAYQQVGNLGSHAQDFAGTAQEQYEYYMDENPLAVGAVALALGAAVGMAIPTTRVENKWMGATRDDLLEQAKETANDAVGKVQKVAGQFAGQVTETVKAEAKNQGLA